jgi:hypothetical protein
VSRKKQHRLFAFELFHAAASLNSGYKCFIHLEAHARCADEIGAWANAKFKVATQK